MMPTLETARLRLRPFRRDDVDALLELFSDPETMRFSLTGVRDRDETAAWLDVVQERIDRDGHGFWALELRESGFDIAEADAPRLRGYVDLLHGEERLARCLIVCAAAEGGVVRYDFKRRTEDGPQAPADYARDPDAPVALIDDFVRQLSNFELVPLYMLISPVNPISGSPRMRAGTHDHSIKSGML